MINVIYILGFGHSGSTLLDTLLGSNTHCLSMGEIRQWSKIRNSPHLLNENNPKCSCKKSISECSFYKNITDDFTSDFEIKAHLPLKSYFKLLVSLFLNKSSPVPLDNYIDFLKTINEKTQYTYIIDSSKTLTNLIKLYNSERVNVKVIHLIRDIRGVGNSYNKLKYYNFYKALFWWAFSNILYAKFLKKTKLDYLTVNYDSFAKNPDFYMQKIGEWLDLDYSNYIEDVNQTEYHQIAGNNMRFEKFTGVVYDDKWKREMPWVKKLLTKTLSVFFSKLNYKDSVKTKQETNSSTPF